MMENKKNLLTGIPQEAKKLWPIYIYYFTCFILTLSQSISILNRGVSQHAALTLSKIIMIIVWYNR